MRAKQVPYYFLLPNLYRLDNWPRLQLITSYLGMGYAGV